MGSKDIFYPHEKLLIQESNWVVVNIGYRLAPKNAYPTHLMDVKRSIRWLKQNISSFGGDPNFIVLSGNYLTLQSVYNTMIKYIYIR